MDEFAIVPREEAQPAADMYECSEAIAEQNFSRKKLIVLEQGIGRLQKTAREQHKAVSALESGMKSVISETDLRRAIGLALQELEARLEDAFQDSNRKCLAMFSRREDVAELQGLIGKKVNWAEYNAVLKKLSDLRQYVDAMAESVFVGHREALNQEFAKKADKAAVEVALKSKADFDEVNEVRARLERLEVLVTHTDQRQSARLQELKDETHRSFQALSDKQEVVNADVRQSLAGLRDDQRDGAERLSACETDVVALQESVGTLKEVQKVLRSRQENILLTTVKSLSDRYKELDEATKGMRTELTSLGVDVKAFQESSLQQFSDLLAQAGASKEQIDFLMQASEMVKRRSRETSKCNTEKFKNLGDAQDRLVEQLAALERSLKKQEREVRALDHRAAKAALPAPAPETPSPNHRLVGVLDQLEKIASGCPLESGCCQQAEPFALVDPQRPPLPWGGGGMSDAKLKASAVAPDLAEAPDLLRAGLPRFAAGAGPAPIDSARGCGVVPSGAQSASLRGMCGVLSPRCLAGPPAAAGGGPQSARAAPRKKR